MAAKRFLITFAVAALLASTGCRHWCERHYPCQPAPVYAGAAAAPACVPCVPCCPQTNYASPAAPAANWTQQPMTRSGCYCP